MTNVPEISVVVPTHQRHHLLSRVLGALGRQTLDRTQYEIIVCCDGCNDGSADLTRELATKTGAHLETLEQERSGAATARNHGASRARAPLILFLDDDMIAAPDLLAIHLARRTSSPDAVVLGSMGVHEDSPASFLTEGLSRWAAARHARLEESGEEIPATEVLTGHLCVTAEAFESVGRFDPSFTAGGTFGGEDLDFGWRLRDCGIPVVFEPRAQAQQLWDKSFGALCANIRQAGAADVRLSRKHPGMRVCLTLGQIDKLPPWERRALVATLERPWLATPCLLPVRSALGLAARLGAKGSRLEQLHAICRAHLYALGMRDAGDSKAR
jgi:GT2 family glycosyltransferase